MKNLLITGGSGYLGAELVRRALAAGSWQVTATYHTQQIAQPGACFVPLDLADAGAVQRLLADMEPDVVIHTAYVQRGPDLWNIAALGAGRVAAAAQAIGAQLIHVSSDVIFDGERADAYTEHDPPSPISPYGKAKAEAERLVAQAHSGALIARTSLIYGGITPSIHEQLVFDVLDGRKDLAFFFDELRNPVQVTDLADALLELAQTRRAGVLNVAGTDAVSRYEFAQLIAAAHGRSAAALRGASSATSSVPRPRRCVLDSTAAQRILSTRLRGAREVLEALG